MAWYLVEIRYVPERLAEVRPRHREFISTLAERGILAVAGPLADDSGSVSLIEASDLDALHAVIDADPYYTEGVIAERTVREYRPLFGAWLP